MRTDQEIWTVLIEASSPEGIDDSTRVHQILHESDLGGDIVEFVDGPFIITLAVVAAAY
ncbi:MAG: hypothetical protein JJD93_05045, partial [Ilumatobacteraceae bacterium]|nr:hypothetical protein [Ilumatobacteraceae bacterium]